MKILTAIARTAARLCDARDAQIFLVEGTAMRLVAQHGSVRTTRHLGEPFPVSRGAVHGRAVLTRRVVHVRDLKTAVRTQYPELAARQRATGTRTYLAVPLLSDGAAVGVIMIRRTRVSPFSSRQIALLRTFADQAVIAIENMRLAHELAEALEQQTATAEILRAISTSPVDLQPVFDAIVRNAVTLCGAAFGGLHRLDGDRITLEAQFGVPADELAILRHDVFPIPLSRESATGRAILDRRAVHIRDIRADAAFRTPRLKTMQDFRTVLAVPLVREGAPIGALALWRPQVRPFTDAEIGLVRTFADQAVIAIENVRLFKELDTRNRDLTQALEQQTATSEILRVIARSATELAPVFEAVVTRSAHLCDAADVAMLLVDGGNLRIAAGVGPLYRSIPSDFTILLTRGSVATRAVVDRTTIHVDDLLAEPDEEYPVGRELARRFGHRTMLAVPLVREGVPIGVICAFRLEVRPFPEQQVALLRTFADQAVIAIENVRLFKELETRNADLTEALEQQTATGEILRAISSSPTKLQPVLDTVVRSAARFCGAYDVCIFRLDGDHLRLDAHHGPVAQPDGFLLPVVKGTVGGRTVLERRVIHVEDLLAETTEFPEAAANARRLGFRTILSVPLVREGVAIGAIQLRQPESIPFTDKQVSLLQTFSDQAVIAIENVRLFAELQEKNRALTEAHGQVSEALEQQTATSEILRTIAHAQTDAQPVFDTIVRSAARLCRAATAAVFLSDGRMLYHPANHGGPPEALAAARARYPLPLDMHSVPGMTILTRSVVHVPDIEDASVVEIVREIGRSLGFRSLVSVPMMRETAAFGAILVTRRDPGRFSDGEVELLKTFADQAVIAIENVRLFTELQEKNRALTQAHEQVTEALEQQTATSEILRTIAHTQTDAQPVFDAIVRNAVRLCGALNGGVYRFDGQLVHSVAHDGFTPEQLAQWRATWPRPVSASSVACQAIRTRGLVKIPDIEIATSLPHLSPDTLANLRARGTRSVIAVPMWRQGEVIGAISLGHRDIDAFSSTQMELLTTFADQAVIAIENVRLFRALEGRNRDLTETLERQTATSEILRVISSFQTDVQPVFDAIAAKALDLCRATTGWVYRFDGELIHIAAAHSLRPEAVAVVRQSYPMPPSRGGATARAILSRAIVYIPDIREDHEYQLEALAKAAAYVSVLAVPMLLESKPIGVITVTGAEPEAFSQKQIELLQTFADQAVIAVENVRLFKELEARTADLTRSVDQLTALGEVGRAVSSTLDLETVLTTIVSRAVELSGLDGGVVFEYEEDAGEFLQRAQAETDGALAAARRATRIRRGEGVVGRTAITLEPVQVPDITVPGAYVGPNRENLIESGVRAIVAVPMVREGRLIGCLGVTRNRPGEFPPGTIDLLRTFATQSALAIQNARLFHEIADKSRQLEAASRHKSEFLANMSHELRTPLNAVIGFSEVLLQRMFGDLTPKQEEYLKDIYASGQHLLSLINDILDLSKVEAGRMELMSASFHLPSALDNAVTLVRERAARHGVTLRIDVDPELGEIVGDERKVKQVLLNLLSNAVKFTPEGGTIGLKAGRREEHAVEISVTDTGIGIAPEDQAAIFEEFRQVGSDERKREGTGLGLALAKKFVELHGGRLWVESEPGRGSTFTFTLPVS
ncbi:MAG TPA: GAF domain-containing protein [Methylomirabilota bacterium]|nr:GAF domain-containing protein [Methylomirabilota bacterium]